MVTRATRDKQQPPAPPDDRQVRLQPTKGDRPSVEIDSSTHGVDDRLRLLIDFLLHEVVELALHNFRELDLEGLNGTNGGETIISTESVDV